VSERQSHQRSTHQRLAWLLIMILGAWQSVFGRTQYLGDWICYLNVSRAVSALDWRAIFDPMWNPGYPVLVALAREFAPQTSAGEWYAISVLNWLIFLGAFASWRYLVRQALILYDPSLEGRENTPTFLWTTTCLFLSCILGLERVSSVSPDLLVSALFILAAAQVVAQLNSFRVSSTVMLGIVLGVGFWVKSVFLPFACIFLFTLLIACLAKLVPWRSLGLTVAVYLALFLPYVFATSWSYGRFTLGESGTLNYAFHVNHLPHWTNWQGGPAEFGKPIHPTRQLLKDLPVFEFAAPFKSTYPPYNNMAYWYQGFIHFFSLRLQILALIRSCYFLAEVIKENSFFLLVMLAFFVAVANREYRLCIRNFSLALWPLLLPAALGIVSYLLVHVEDRYLGPFFVVLGLIPLAPLVDSKLNSNRILSVSIVLLYIFGTGAELKAREATTLRATLRGITFRDDKQWKLAQRLPTYGLRGGARVAVIPNSNPSLRCTWAYMAGIRIAAEFGSPAWQLAPSDRTWFERYKLEQSDADYGKVFFQLSPQDRTRVLAAFRQTGVQAVVALSQPGPSPEPGWQHIDGTESWIYNFDADSTNPSQDLASVSSR
jgi:hypothetical protein